MSQEIWRRAAIDFIHNPFTGPRTIQTEPDPGVTPPNAGPAQPVASWPVPVQPFSALTTTNKSAFLPIVECCYCGKRQPSRTPVYDPAICNTCAAEVEDADDPMDGSQAKG